MRSRTFLLLRSSRQEVFCEKGLTLATLLKKGLWHRCFPVNFVKFLRTPFLTEHPWWLLLDLQLSHGTKNTWIKKHSSKEVASITYTLEKNVFVGATSEGL